VCKPHPLPPLSIAHTMFFFLQIVDSLCSSALLLEDVDVICIEETSFTFFSGMWRTFFLISGGNIFPNCATCQKLLNQGPLALGVMVLI